MDDWFMDTADESTPTRVYKEKYLEMKAAVEVVENRIAEELAKIEKERKEEEEKKKKEEEEKKKKEEEEKKKDEAVPEEETLMNEFSKQLNEEGLHKEDFEKMSDEEQQAYMERTLKEMKERYAKKMKAEGKEYDAEKTDKNFEDLLRQMKNLKKEEAEL